MGRYHQARQQLKAMVEQTLRADLAPARDERERERLEQMVDSRSEQLLDNFEAIVELRVPRADGYWRGVGQSILGSLSFVVIAALFLYGWKHDYVSGFLSLLLRKP